MKTALSQLSWFYQNKKCGNSVANSFPKEESGKSVKKAIVWSSPSAIWTWALLNLKKKSYRPHSREVLDYAFALPESTPSGHCDFGLTYSLHQHNYLLKTGVFCSIFHQKKKKKTCGKETLVVHTVFFWCWGPMGIFFCFLRILAWCIWGLRWRLIILF